MPTAQKKPFRGFGCFFFVLAGFLLLIAFAIFSFSSAISGSEFSPNTFQTRSFSYSRIPGTRIRVAPTKLGASLPIASIDVLKHLPTLNRTQEWHVVSISGSSAEVYGANVLVSGLKQRTAEGVDMWGTWSLSHPNAASILWPLVQQVAFQQLYECIPELLEVAESIDDPASLEKEVLAVIARTVSERIKRSTEEAQTTELLNWLSSISVHDSENVEWFNRQKDQIRKTLAPLAP